MKYLSRSLFVILSVFIGLYPLCYFVFDMSEGFFAQKGVVAGDSTWRLAFYVHITFGGIALLAGFTQFFRRLRERFVKLHVSLGKIYVASVLLGGAAGLFLSLFAMGGIVAIVGFFLLGAAWLFTTAKAYGAIKKHKITEHKQWMIRSYSLCWAAVMLRLLIPSSQIFLDIEFLTAYKFIAWLCWVPNLIVAELIIRNLDTNVRSLSPRTQW